MNFILTTVLAASLTVASVYGASVKWQTGIDYKYGNTIYTVNDEINQNFGPSNLFKDNNNAWCIHGKKGYVRIAFPSRMQFQTILIKDGNQAGPNVFEENGRVKTILIKANGHFKQKFQLEDIMGEQVVKLKTLVDSRWFRMEILDTYPGTKNDITCMSGMKIDLAQFNN